MTESQTIPTTDQPAPDPQVHIHRKTFERIEGLRKRVAETTVTLDRAAREHKDAKSAHETATTNLSSAVSDMVNEVNGISKLPLFDNQTDAIARAEADPVAQKLLSRMLDHGVTNVNALIVAGYDEAQRNELAAYLDALDARKKAESEGAWGSHLPELPEMPAFIAPGVQSEDEITDLVVRLTEQGLTLKAEHIAALTNDQWNEVDTWLSECDRVKTEKGEALVMDDLPAAPSYLVQPGEVLPAAEPEPDYIDEITGTKSDQPKKPRAPRRSSAEFTNRPRVVKAKKAKKGGQ